MLKCFLDNNLITLKQSGLRPGDSSINKLLSITYDIFTSFDNSLEVRGVFLDISKAFNKVWHDGRTQFVIFKPLSYCFEETIGFDVNDSFTSRPVLCLIS